MTLRIPRAAPLSRVAPERRGAVVGRFCHDCATVFGKHRARHVGKGLNGRDHVASPCAHEGQLFRDGDAWWEPAVEVRPAPPPAPAPAAAPTAPPPK
jgi:hypothetical protein